MSGKNLIVKQVPIQTAVSVHASIPEFELPADPNIFEARYQDTEHIIYVAYVRDVPAGYLIAYDKYRDGSMYCWMTGVISEFRRHRVLTAMMNELEQWSKQNGYRSLRLKTRNSRRAMLHYVVKNGYRFLELTPNRSIEDNRILLEKQLYL